MRAKRSGDIRLATLIQDVGSNIHMRQSANIAA